jgi:hypothetical protein
VANQEDTRFFLVGGLNDESTFKSVDADHLLKSYGHGVSTVEANPLVSDV